MTLRHTARDWVAAAVEGLFSDGRGGILVAVAGGWLLALGARGIYPALLPYVTDAYDISLAATGTLLSVLWVMYAFGQLPGGVIADWVGERNVLLFSGSVTVTGLFVIVLPYDTRILYAGTLLLGLGAGLYGTTRLTILTDTYPDNDGVAIGVSSATGHVGSSALPMIASVIAAVLGWMYGFLFVVPLFCLTLFGLWYFVPRRTRPDASDAPASEDRSTAAIVRRLARSMTNTNVFVAVLLMLCMSIVFQSFISFYPTYLVAQKGVTETTAAVLYGIFFGLAVIVQPAAGVVSDRFDVRWSLYVVFGMTAVAMYGIVTADSLPLLLVFSVVASAQLGFWPIIYPYLIGHLPTEAQGSGLGFLRFGYMVIAAGGPAVVGLLADRGLFDASFLLLGVVALGSLAICAVLPRER